MFKLEERKKRKRINNFFEKKNNSKSEKPSNDIDKSLPKGFSTEESEDFIFLFYGKKRIATFCVTKVIKEKIEQRIKEFQKDKHKHNR